MTKPCFAWVKEELCDTGFSQTCFEMHDFHILQINMFIGLDIVKTVEEMCACSHPLGFTKNTSIQEK